VKRIAFAALVACALSAANAVLAAIVVYPTGDYPTDVQNVQAAVDQGGTVLLKAQDAAGVATAFNFGPPVQGLGFVTLHRDVELLGERLGATITTVDGGWYPVRGGFEAIKATIRGIAFAGPLEGALFFFNPMLDVEIIGNQILDVVGFFFPGFGTQADAIVVRGGRAVIAYNVIEDIDAEFAIGISQNHGTGPVEIIGNRVSGVNSIAIESTANPGTVTITDNVVHPGPERYPNGSFGAGIEINGTGAYYVARNDALIENFFGVGIFAFGTEAFGFGPVDGAVIEKNRIELAGDVFGGIVLVGLVFDTYIGQNNITGTGVIAFALIDMDPTLGSSDLGSNTIVGNNIARVQSGFADVALDDASHDTVLKGHGGSVDDIGTNNQISGFTKGGQPGTGQQVSKAVRQRNQAAQFAARHALIGP
jgi:hypothetical protein